MCHSRYLQSPPEGMNMSSSYRPRVPASMVVVILCVWGIGSVRAEPVPTTDAAPAAPASLVNVSVGLGWGNLDVDGNLRRYEQYVTPPHGIFLSELDLRRWEAAGHWLLDLRLRDLWQPSANGDLWLSAGNGDVVVRAVQRHSSFFPDWGEPDSDSLSRRDGRYDLTTSLGRGELRASYREARVAPSGGGEGANWRDSFSGLSYGAHLGGWQAGVSYQNERFSFGEGNFLTGNAATTTLRVAPPANDRTFLEGTAALTQTSLDGRSPAPRSYRLALEGEHLLGPDLTLLGDLSYYNVTGAIAETAFARSGSNAQFTAEYRGLWHTVLDVGGGVRTVGFVNNAEYETTSTEVRSFQAKAVTALSRALKLKASHTRWWTHNRPLSFDLGGDPEGAVVWSSKTDQRAELSYAPDWRAGGTASWHSVQWDNSDFASSNSIVDTGLFGWWIPQERCTVYGTLMWQAFRLEGPFLPGSFFATDTRTWLVGASYQLSPATLADVSYTRSQSSGALGADQRVWTAALSHRWRSGDRLSARIALDDFATSEATPTVDYNADLFEVRFTKAAF